MESFKFPHGGNDVTIVRKQDILDCIEQNIVDKDVALAIVEQCEIDIVQNVVAGKWTGIPFIGSLKPNTFKKRLKEETKEIDEEAKATMDKSSYVLFRKNLAYNVKKREKLERTSNYITSMAITRYKFKYKLLCKTKGEAFARAYMYLTNFIVAIENEEIIER